MEVQHVVLDLVPEHDVAQLVVDGLGHSLGEDVGDHVLGRAVLQVDDSSLHLRPNEVLLDGQVLRPLVHHRVVGKRDAATVVIEQLGRPN